ncbi:MAG: 50S ribosomal protein L11 methyltransferase [Ruminococcaceae bacterium]|nr:50S ribosomal protein L11 methyltransferase [Oscillospiraceae bacterium]
MQYLEVTIKTTAQGIGLTADALTAMGYDSLVLDDQTEYEKFLEENRACWDYIDESLAQRLRGLSQIKLYLENDDHALARLDELREAMQALIRRHPRKNLGSLTVSAAPLDEEDWANSWKKNYPPQFIGQRLCVLPYWMDRAEAQGRLPVILDPGLTFGTGSHPSTQMCMAALEENLRPGSRVVDLGSGSGILSIAALRLGAETAVGVDIDPKAENMARENAAYNGFGDDRFRAFTGDVAGDSSALKALGGGFDLALVNIVADVIIALSPVLPRVVRPGGLVICSGILDTRLEEVRGKLEEQGLTILEQRAQEDWRCLVALREG